MDFAARLRELRAAAALTQAALAERSGVPLRTIQGWEQGYRCPVTPAFFNLAKALGVEADAFSGIQDVASVKPAKSKRKAPKKNRQG